MDAPGKAALPKGAAAPQPEEPTGKFAGLDPNIVRYDGGDQFNRVETYREGLGRMMTLGS